MVESGRQRRVRFGAYLPAYHLAGEPPPTAREMADYARRAEELGLDSVWTIDHLFVSPPSYRVSFLEPLTMLTVAATATERVKLGPGIVVLPLREPVTTAKTLASIDVLSGGRLIFGVGVGWDQKELDACQIERRTRGRRMDEMLDVIVGLWTQESFSYSGKHFTLNDITMDTRPLQNPRPPIWLAAGSVPSGTSQHITAEKGYAPERSMRRVARIGDALMSAYRSVPDGDNTYLKKDRAVLDELLREEGRDPAEVEHAIQDHMYISLDGDRREMERAVARFTYKSYDEIAPYYLIGTPDDIIPKIQARIDAGISEIDVNFIDRDPEQLERFARYIMPHFKSG